MTFGVPWHAVAAPQVPAANAVADMGLEIGVEVSASREISHSNRRGPPSKTLLAAEFLSNY